jgi:DNA-binding response OmpR family regulator
MPTILIIEDDDNVRDVIHKALDSQKYHVLLASDGQAGINLLKDHTVDLIITDIIMPRKEGIETIMEAKVICPDVKIIAISGGGRLRPENYLELAESFGADRVFTKPFHLKDLVTTINELLD